MTRNSSVMRFGPFEADLHNRELRKHGLKLKLQEQPFQVLAVLLERGGQLVTREELRAKLWPEDTFIDFDHGLNAAVRRLREALNDSADVPRFVETLPRRGYKFIAPVQRVRLEATLESEAEVPAPTVPSRTATQDGNPDENAAVENAPNESGEASEAAGSVQQARRTGLAVSAWPAACMLVLFLGVLGAVLWRSPLRRTSTAETVQRQLTANPSEIPLQAAAISPDGNYLAYSDPNGLYVQLIKTGQTQTLSVPGQFVASDVSWLPDGTGILASAEQRPGSFSIWLISILGGFPRRLRDGSGAPAVSGDGTRIAFLGDFDPRGAHGIWVMDINGENARRVLAAKTGEQFFRVRWSPDGQRLAVTRSVPGLPAVNLPQAPLGTETLESVGLNGGNATAILTEAGLQDFYWLPDGRILFSVSQEEMFGADSNLWVIHTDLTGKPAGRPVQLTNWAGFSFTDFSATKDGKRLAFLKLTSQADVYVGAVEPDGTELKTPQRLTLNDRNDWPSGWTPDSSAVVFWSDRNGGWNLFKQRLGQDAVEAIATGPGPKWYSRFSPDGAWFLYMALPNKEMPGGALPVRIMRVPGSGGPAQEVLSAAGTTDFRCARAPATVCVFDETRGNDIVFTSFDPVHGRGREVFRAESSGIGGAEFDLSPDGSRLAITQSESRDGRIRLVSLIDGTTSDLVVEGWNRFWDIDWAPNGRGLYVGSDMPQGGAVLYVNLRGEARLLWQQRGNIVTCGMPSPDGRFLAIAGWTTNSNAWMIENY